MMITRVLATLSLLCLYLTANAHEIPIHYDHVSLSANASKEVPQDELQVTLYAVSEADDAKTTSDEVSSRVHKALSILNNTKDLTTQTGSFNTHPVYRKQKITGWRSRQTLEVKSTNAAELSQLLGRLQNHVLIENIRYNVSEQSRRLTENQLIDEAIANFQHRARQITNGMQRKKYRLVDMNISTSHPRPQLMHARMATSMAESSSAPPIQSGKQRIEVTISGKIEVQLNNQ